MSLPAARCVLAALLSLCLLGVSPVAAQAEVFFVDQSGSGVECSEEAPCATIAQALATSRATGGTGDRIEVGPGLYAERVVIDKAEDTGLTLHGAGRGPDQETTPPEATTVRSPETNIGAALAVSGASAVSIESLRVEVPAGFINGEGISLGGPAASAHDVHVQDAGGVNTDGITVTVGTPDALIVNARVRHVGEYRGISIFGPRATITDSDMRAAHGALVTEFTAETTRVLRSRLEATGSTTATIRSADVVIDSSLLIGSSLGVEAFANSGAINLVTLSNDTIDVGEPKVADNGGVAVRARAEGASTAGITLVDSLTVEKQEVEGDATQSITCSASIVPLQEESGPKGTIDCGAGGGNIFAPASEVFTAGADWHLAPGSPAVDSGSGGAPLSSADLDGAPRVVDGNRDGVAVIDRGAYELPTPPPPGSTVAPSNSFTFGKLKRNKRKGTAKLQVKVPGPGAVVLSGKKVKKATLDAKRAGAFSLSIVPKRKLARTLRSRGSAKASIRVSFTPTGGTANTRSKSVKLIRR